MLPRHLEIIYEVNRRLLDDVRARSPGDEDRVRRVSLIQESPEKRVRMAHLAVVGSHSTNGVAAIHSDLLQRTVLKDLAEHFPERFNNKTNGVTPRRWLLQANPELSDLITEAIGDRWVTELDQLEELVSLANDAPSVMVSAGRIGRPRPAYADWLKSTTGHSVDPDSIFDSQIKRIHEYKRQLLNVLHILVLYNRLRENHSLEMPPRTVFFAGKAAPAYTLAKRIIHFINNVAAVIDADPAIRGRLKVLFLPEYNVSLAQRLIPASDISEQISTAGYEASGTSNMKFMMNGALTVGTRDGATIEMATAAGEKNFFLFGLTAEQVQASRGWYDPRWHDENEPETHRALDLIRSGAFDGDEPGVFRPIVDTLADPRRSLHAPRRPDVLRKGAGAGKLALPAARRLGPQGYRERRPLRHILQRPHDLRIRPRHLEGGSVPRSSNLIHRQHLVRQNFPSRSDPMPDSFGIESRITKVLVQALGVEKDDIKPSATLQGDLGAESIDFLDIVFRLEREFMMRIPRGELFSELLFQDVTQILEDGRVTDSGLAMLRSRLPYADLSALERDRRLNRINDLITVKLLSSYVRWKLGGNEEVESDRRARGSRVCEELIMIAQPVSRSSSPPESRSVRLRPSARAAGIVGSRQRYVDHPSFDDPWAQTAILAPLADPAGEEMSPPARLASLPNPDPGVAEFEHEAVHDRRRSTVRRWFGRLGKRERWILTNRYGLSGGAEQTLAQIGRELGISKQRVSQIAARAENKLRMIARRETLEALEI